MTFLFIRQIVFHKRFVVCVRERKRMAGDGEKVVKEMLGLEMKREDS